MRVAFKIAIINAGVTQRQLSVAAGVPECRLSDIVRGRATPNDAERERLSVFLKRPEHELFPVAVNSNVAAGGDRLGWPTTG
jgi:transcriptional regulator with XRE-family HTH domain